MAADGLVPIEGSHRDPIPGATVAAASDPDQQLVVTVYVRPNPGGNAQVDPAAEARRPPRDRRYLGPAEVIAQFGADPADLAAVADWARGLGLTVAGLNVAARSIRLAGTAGALGQAFGVELQTWEHPGGKYRGRTGRLYRSAM
jgi:kumamolisin